MAAAPDADHDFDSASSIATATAVTAPSTIATSSAVTSTGTAGIAGVARSGMIAAMPVGMEMGVAGANVAEITAAVRSGATGGPPPVSLALLRLFDQQQANQSRPAKCDAEDHHRVCHGVP
jgi:hypothetical protein